MIAWAQVGERLEAARRDGRGIVLSTHVNADGDGLGCEIALHDHLAAQGHKVLIINSDPVPRKYAFMKGAERVQVFHETTCRGPILEAGLFFVLDNSSPARLGRLLPLVQGSRAFKICIDHHADVDPFWDLNCVDQEASASGQLVYDLIRALGGRITPIVAEALYVSFVTDTGHFRFSKSTARVHRIIADLMDSGGINPPVIYRSLFEELTPGLNRLVAHALADTHYEYGARFAWARLTRAQLESCDGYEEDTGDLVNMLLAVQGVQAAALFKELPGDRTKVSLRSRGDVDVNAVAGKFGGGGHRNASGILMSSAFEQGVREVVAAMKEALPPE